MVCPQTNGQYVQIGLKSSNENCMEKIQIFGSLNPYIDWIHTKFNNLTLEVDTLNSDAKGSSLSVHVNTKFIFYHILFILCYYLLK